MTTPRPTYLVPEPEGTPCPNWELGDPAAQDLDGVWALRGEIDAYVTDLLQTLGIDRERPAHA